MMRRTLALIGAIVSCAACSNYRAYDGEPREREEVAVIVGDFRFNAGLPVTLLLREVDGKRLALQQRGVEVLPGDHTLLVDCVVQETKRTSRHELQVSVASGRRYGLRAELSPGLTGCASIELEARD